MKLVPLPVKFHGFIPESQIDITKEDPESVIEMAPLNVTLGYVVF